jgi:TonB family protein
MEPFVKIQGWGRRNCCTLQQFFFFLIKQLITTKTMNKLLFIFPFLLLLTTAKGQKTEAEVFTIIQQMPRFPGCEDLEGTSSEKKACADKKLVAYISENVRYPRLAQENQIEGMAVVSFTVMEDGRLDNFEVLRDPGAGTGAEAQRVLEAMNNLPMRWTPGRHDGKAVRVRYNLPIRFKLNEKIKQETEEDTEIIDAPTFDLEPEPVNNNPLQDQIFTIVEEMPRFPGCEDTANKKDRDSCARSALATYVYANLQYPETAKEAGIEGVCVVRYTVAYDGKVTDVKLLRDAGHGMGEEALRVVESMNAMPQRWIPGKHRGYATNVRYNTPIVFRLDKKGKQKRKNKRRKK